MARITYFSKQALRYSLFIFFLTLSAQIFAGTVLYGMGGEQKYSTIQEACTAYNANAVAQSVSNINDPRIVASCSFAWVYKYESSSCPSSGTLNVLSVPRHLLDSQVCISNCLWNPAGTGSVCGEHGICSDDFKSAGTSCSQNTDLTPTDADKNPPLSCTAAYCENPSNKACPTGYVKGSFNNKSICIKSSSSNPNPNDPNNNPNDPNDPNNNGKGNCNGSNNCNVTNNDFDVSSIVNAITTLSNDIKSALSSLGSSLASKLDSIFSETKQVKDNTAKSNEHLEKIKENGDKTNEKLDESNEHLDAIEDSSASAARTLGDIKDFITEDFNPSDGDTKLDIGGDSPTSVDTNVNFSGSCPASINVPFHFGSINTSIEFSYRWFCQLAAFLKPIVIAFALFTSALIIGGVKGE